MGKAAHKKYNPGPNYKTSRSLTRLFDNSYPDAVDRVNHIVRELKPNNPRAMKRGLEQAKRYARKLQDRIGGTWHVAVDTWESDGAGGFNYSYGELEDL
jgi:hypothetical protein